MKAKAITVKAAVLREIGGSLSVEKVTLPPVGFGQVRVRIEAAGLCGSQLLEIDGLKGNAGYLPHLMGHEGIGTVLECGPGVTRVKERDRVVLHWRKGAGLESPTAPVYQTRRGPVGAGPVVTFAEQVVVSENRTTRVRPDTPRDVGALLGCSLSTALSLVEKEADVKLGENVLIIGCGGLGLCLTLACRLRGAETITVLDLGASKLSVAEKLGATYFCDVGRMKKWSEGAVFDRLRFDVVLDTVGAPAQFEEGMNMLAPSGRYVLIGHPRPGVSLMIPDAHRMFLGEGKRIFATQGGGCIPHIDIPRYARAFGVGAFSIDGIITEDYRLINVNAAVAQLRTGAAGRILLIP